MWGQSPIESSENDRKGEIGKSEVEIEKKKKNEWNRERGERQGEWKEKKELRKRGYRLGRCIVGGKEDIELLTRSID